MTCKGIVGIVKDKSARVMLELEKDYKILDPAATNLVRDGVSPRVRPPAPESIITLDQNPTMH